MSVPVPSLPTRVEIREVGPRDGLQLEAPLSVAERGVLLEALVATGVGEIEATAFVAPTAVPAMAGAREIAALTAKWPDVVWSALIPNPRGARDAVAAGLSRVEYVVSVSDSHSRANVGRTTDEAIEAAAAVAEIVHPAGGHLEVILATAWDCPFDGRTPVGRTVSAARRAVELGADAICIADTIGTTVPGRVAELVAAVREVTGSIPLGIHLHNTRGTGIASAWAAVEAGVTRLDAAAGGLGGCPFAPGASGNIATEELVYLLEESGVSTGIDLAAVLDAARLTERLVGHTVDSNLLRADGPLRPRGTYVEEQS